MSATKTSERKGSKNVRNVNTIRCFCARVGLSNRSAQPCFGDDGRALYGTCDGGPVSATVTP
jgi:hypothetical protein